LTNGNFLSDLRWLGTTTHGNAPPHRARLIPRDQEAWKSGTLAHQDERYRRRSVVFAVIVFGLLFGLIGIIVAAPLTVLVLVAVKKLYIRDALGQRTDSYVQS